MCTAVNFGKETHYFGRNLDVDRSFGEAIVITPRNYPLGFRHEPILENHYAIIGMAKTIHGFPLYFDGTNETGLSVAALNFPRNAYYYPYEENRRNIASFEVIPYILSICKDVEEAEALLSTLTVTNDSFCPEIPPTPLHWIISDKNRSIVLESTVKGTELYQNPFGILTNNPPFAFHEENMHRYMGLHEGLEENLLSENLTLKNTSIGFGAVGLPGDFSSVSRFVKAVYVKEKSQYTGSERENVHQFFHILASVAMPKGSIRMENGAYEYTRYSGCCNTDLQIYYYNTYNDLSIRKVELRKENLDTNHLIEFPIEE